MKSLSNPFTLRLKPLVHSNLCNFRLYGWTTKDCEFIGKLLGSIFQLSPVCNFGKSFNQLLDLALLKVIEVKEAVSWKCLAFWSKLAHLQNNPTTPRERNQQNS